MALKSFWETRGELGLAEAYEAALPDELLDEENWAEQVGAAGSEGLHAKLKGMTMHPDLRRDLPQLPAPLLLLTSSEDRWVLPRHAEAIAASLSGWKNAGSPEDLGGTPPRTSSRLVVGNVVLVLVLILVAEVPPLGCEGWRIYDNNSSNNGASRRVACSTAST